MKQANAFQVALELRRKQQRNDDMQVIWQQVEADFAASLLSIERIDEDIPAGYGRPAMISRNWLYTFTDGSRLMRPVPPELKAVEAHLYDPRTRL